MCIRDSPYTKKMPTSKLMMPLGFATNHPLIPINVALYYGVVSSVLETAGFMEPVSMIKFSAVNFAMAVAFLVWSLVAYRLLPDHPIAAAEVDAQAKIEKTKAVPMEPWKEKVTVVAFVVSVVGMMLINNLGNMAYVIPGLSAMALLFMKVVDFKEFRENMFAPVILMMAGVIGVADALANSGFTAMIGEAIATALGTSVAPLLVIILFALLTSTCATFTGSNMGSVYIFAPIAIAACMSLGLNPTAAAAAVVVSGWQGGYMPIDGMPAMIMGMGKYKLPEFWKFTVPMYLIRIIALSVEMCIRDRINRQIDAGVDAVFCLGTNGEFYIMSAEEKIRVMEIFVDEVKGRVPVYAGTGCISTEETVALSRKAQEIGVDVLSVITPYFAAISQEELYQHYAQRCV